jgi:NADPH:quinone reductase-like Zn-dependent oxidoreductase
LEPVDRYGIDHGLSEDFRLMLRSAETARLKPVIDSIHPLADAQKAMGIMESGKQFGKIVLEMV